MEPITEPAAKTSPRLKARMAGLFYLLTFLTGAPLLLVGKRLIVAGNAAATATNIQAHESLFWLGFTSNLVVLACYVAVTALFYDLFRVVSRSLSRTAAFFSLVGLAVQAAGSAFYLAPRVILGGDPYLDVFKVEQLQAMALLFLKLNTQAYNVGLAFFGFYCLLIGCLILRSTFLPRIGQVDGPRRSGLADLSVTTPGAQPVPLRSAPRRSRRRIADLVAARLRPERSAMEGAGQRGTAPPGGWPTLHRFPTRRKRRRSLPREDLRRAFARRPGPHRRGKEIQ
jgi:hypothetical protein